MCVCVVMNLCVLFSGHDAAQAEVFVRLQWADSAALLGLLQKTQVYVSIKMEVGNKTQCCMLVIGAQSPLGWGDITR